MLITIDKLKQLNLNYLIVLPALIQGLQSVVGLPLSSFFMKRYGKYYISTGSQSEYSKILQLKKRNTQIHYIKISYFKNDLLRLFIMFTLASLAFVIGNYTHIHYSIISLAFGVIGLK